MVKKYFLLVLLALSLPACKSMPDWLGSDSDKDKLEGERIAVLKADAGLRQDYSLDTVPVKIPFPVRNTRWYKSSGFHPLTAPNPQGPWTVEKMVHADAGEGGSDAYVLMASPVVAEDVVYTMDGRGKVSAWQADNIRKKRWSVTIKIPEGKGNYSSAGMTYYQGKLYCTTGYDIVVALDAENGQELWRRAIASIGRSAPEVSDNKLFVNTINNTLYALNSKDGSIIWTHTGVAEEVGVYGGASPLAVGGIVMNAHSSGDMFALKEATGTLLWADTLAVGSSNATFSLVDVDASPIRDEQYVYAVSNSGVTAATDIPSGARVWEQDISSSNTPWVAGDFLYMIERNNHVVALYKKTGGIKWIHALPSYENPEKKKDNIQWSGPVMAGSRLLVVGSHGKMLVLSPFNGGTMQEVDIPEGVYIRPVVANDHIYLFTNDATLVQINGATKEATGDDFANVPDPVAESVEKDKDTEEKGEAKEDEGEVPGATGVDEGNEGMNEVLSW